MTSTWQTDNLETGGTQPQQPASNSRMSPTTEMRPSNKLLLQMILQLQKFHKLNIGFYLKVEVKLPFTYFRS